MDFLKHFVDWPNVASFEAQDIIFCEREPAEHLYVILSGEVELTFHGESLAIEQKGGIIGEMAVIDSASRNVLATALTPVTAAKLNTEQFRSMIDENTSFAMHAMATLANRLRAADNFIRRKLQDSAG
ncbi:MAG: cyclic nucleotide-binding domain-containing protein [Gammaproteobacteria bacterium]|nr:cyclic nucleotide-binding domain-containing protein [Gammaproteobacteria bacterium]NNJ79408.1 cyclic nucleotide-binding domain-containing protein [Xanthomonadales bacterium]